MTTWNAAFEASPADTDEAKYGANKIRELKTAISDRLDLEMNFSAGTTPLIKAGIASVLYRGTFAAMTALSSPSEGAMALTTDTSIWYVYAGSAWEELTPRHSALANLSADDHPQYVNINKVSQTLVQSLSVAAGKTIDGVDISAHAGGSASSQHNGVGGNDFGTWVLANSNTYVKNTNYTAATDGFVVAHAFTANMQITSGTTTTYANQSGNTYALQITMPVRKGTTWKIVMAASDSCYVSWLPVGT